MRARETKREGRYTVYAKAPRKPVSETLESKCDRCGTWTLTTAFVDPFDFNNQTRLCADCMESK